MSAIGTTATPGPLGENLVQVGMLTHQQILNLTVGVQVIPAPGVGYMLEYVAGIFQFQIQGTLSGYTAGAALTYQIGGTTVNTTVPATFLQAAVPTNVVAYSPAQGTAQTPTHSGVDNVPMLLIAPTTPYTGGQPSNKLFYKIVYRVWPLPPGFDQ